jgi:hypothetical protein
MMPMIASNKKTPTIIKTIATVDIVLSVLSAMDLIVSVTASVTESSDPSQRVSITVL